MPKKSKRQKMLTDLRRQHSSTPVAQPDAPTFAFTYKQKSSPLQPVAAVDGAELTAIRHDLTKTLLLAALAIAAELALYWFGRGKV